MNKKNCLEHIVENNLLVDTHVHLHSEQYSNRLNQLFKRAGDSGLAEIWLVATDFYSSLRNIEILAKNNPQMKLRLGVGFDMELLIPGSDLFSHNWFCLEPHELIKILDKNYEQLEKEISKQNLEIDLIGEIGLDYYWLDLNENITDSDLNRSKSLQQVLFEYHLEYALSHGIPVSVHSRGAETEVIETLKKYTSKGLIGILHSFTGNQLQLVHLYSALNCVDSSKNFYIGINGIFTYSNAKSLMEMILRQIVKTISKSENESLRNKLSELTGNKTKLPLVLELLYKSGIVLETDGPYLIPGNANHQELLRVYGKKEINEPASITYILEKVLKELSREGLI